MSFPRDVIMHDSNLHGSFISVNDGEVEIPTKEQAAYMMYLDLKYLYNYIYNALFDTETTKQE